MTATMLVNQRGIRNDVVIEKQDDFTLAFVDAGVSGRRRSGFDSLRYLHEGRPAPSR